MGRRQEGVRRVEGFCTARLTAVILENGVVRTLDPSLPAGRALAIAGAYVAGGVGVHETALASPEAVDLGGRCVLPGFTDSHVHFPTWSLAQRQVKLDGCRSLDEALARIREAEVAPGRWLRGYGWRDGDWGTQHRADEGAARRRHGRDAGDHDLQGLPLGLAQLGGARRGGRRPRLPRRGRRARRARRADGRPPRGVRVALPRPLRAHDRRRVGRGDAGRDQARGLARRRRRSTTRTAGSARPGSSSGSATRGTSRCASGARSRTTCSTPRPRSRCTRASATTSCGSATSSASWTARSARRRRC